MNWEAWYPARYFIAIHDRQPVRVTLSKNGCSAAGQATKSDDLPHGNGATATLNQLFGYQRALNRNPRAAVSG